MSSDHIWQVKLPDGSVHVDIDARPDNPRASWIYARSTADEVAGSVGGVVVEVTRKQQEKLLDQEIASTLAKPLKDKSTKTPKPTKARTRPFSRSALRAIAIAILESIPLNYAARSAIDTAREPADDNEYNAAIRKFQPALPATLWIGHDPKSDQAFVQTAEPVWIAEDPDGESPGQWRQIERDEIVRILVEGA